MVPGGVLGAEGNAEGAAGAVVISIQQTLPVTGVVNGVIPANGGGQEGEEGGGLFMCVYGGVIKPRPPPSPLVKAMVHSLL